MPADSYMLCFMGRVMMRHVSFCVTYSQPQLMCTTLENQITEKFKKCLREIFCFSFPVVKLGKEADGLEKVWNGEKKKLTA